MSMRDYDYWPFWHAADDAVNFIEVDDYNFYGIDPYSDKKRIFGEGAIWYAGHMAVCEFLSDLADIVHESGTVCHMCGDPTPLSAAAGVTRSIVKTRIQRDTVRCQKCTNEMFFKSVLLED